MVNKVNVQRVIDALEKAAEAGDESAVDFDMNRWAIQSRTRQVSLRDGTLVVMFGKPKHQCETAACIAGFTAAVAVRPESLGGVDTPKIDMSFLDDDAVVMVFEDADKLDTIKRFAFASRWHNLGVIETPSISEIAGAFMGLNMSQSRALFTPYLVDRSIKDVSVYDAISTLKRLIVTGDVDWGCLGSGRDNSWPTDLSPVTVKNRDFVSKYFDI